MVKIQELIIVISSNVHSQTITAPFNSVSTCLKMHSKTVSVPEILISMIFPNVSCETVP